MDKNKIEMKATMESAAVAEYLTALAKGFKSGVITVEKDGETLTLTPAEVAEVEVEARVKKDKARFSLEVTWRLAQEQDDPSQLKISAEAPKADTKPGAKTDKKDSKGEDKKSADQKSEVKKPEDQKADDKKAASAVSSSGPMVKVISPAASPANTPAASPAQKPAVAPAGAPAGSAKA